MSEFADLNKLKEIPPTIEKIEIKGGWYTYIKQMTACEYDAFERLSQRPNGDYTFSRQGLVAATMCDENGNLLCSSAADLNDIPAAVIIKLASAATRINRIREQDIEEMEGN